MRWLRSSGVQVPQLPPVSVELAVKAIQYRFKSESGNPLVT